MASSGDKKFERYAMVGGPGPLVCAACGSEIRPGQNVEFIGGEPEQRIMLEGEVLVRHETCP